MKIEMLATIHVKGRPFLRGQKYETPKDLSEEQAKAFILNKSAKKIKEKKARKG